MMPGVDVKKNVIVTISSDKGLCGGINSTSVKISKALHKLNSGMLLCDLPATYLILKYKIRFSSQVLLLDACSS